MSAKDLLKQDSWLFLNKILIKRLGLNASALISELCDKESYFEKDGDWFYLSRERITDDIGLSPDAQRKAGDILIDANILDMKKKGLPARNYYRINEAELLKWIISSDDELQSQDKENPTASDIETQQQAVDISTTRDTEIQRHVEDISTTYKEHIKRTEDKEPNIKTPAPALAEVSPTSSKRNFRKGHEELKDELQSGKDIDEQKKTKKKMSELEKCMAEIDKRNFSDEVKELLRIHLDWSYNSKDPKRITSMRNYKSKLEYLEQRQSKGDNLVNIVQQSIDRCWHAFYEYSTSSDNHKSAASIDNDWLIPQTLHGDEVLEEIERRKKAGMKVY